MQHVDGATAEEAEELRRQVSKGCPVGCLHVPRPHMKDVKEALSAEGQSSRKHWLRIRGVLPAEDDAAALKLHMTVHGAIRFEGKGDAIPRPVKLLLDAGSIRWEPGIRCERGHPEAAKITQILTDIGHANAIRPPAAAGSTSARFSFAELFAGIGGFRLGLERLGGVCTFASEMDPFAAATYAINFGHMPSAGDITEVSNEQLPAHDVLVGGFPCQSFSTAGEQEGLSDHRGQLYLECCRVLCAARPRAFLLENVAGLYTLDGGSFHREYAKRTPGRAFATIIGAPSAHMLCSARELLALPSLLCLCSMLTLSLACVRHTSALQLPSGRAATPSRRRSLAPTPSEYRNTVTVYTLWGLPTPLQPRASNGHVALPWAARNWHRRRWVIATAVRWLSAAAHLILRRTKMPRPPLPLHLQRRMITLWCRTGRAVRFRPSSDQQCVLFSSPSIPLLSKQPRSARTSSGGLRLGWKPTNRAAPAGWCVSMAMPER